MEIKKMAELVGKGVLFLLMLPFIVFILFGWVWEMFMEDFRKRKNG